MPRAKEFQLRTSENRNVPLPADDDLLIVWWFKRTAQLVSLPSYRSWSFLQLTVTLVYTMAAIHYDLARVSPERNVNERIGRIVNTATTIFLSLHLANAFLANHGGWCAMLKSNWWGNQDYNIKTFLKNSQKRVVIQSILGCLLALCTSGSLVLEAYTSLKCHFCTNTFGRGKTRVVGVAGLLFTSVFAVALCISLVTAFVNILLLKLSNSIFAESLFNQLGSLRKDGAETFASTMKLSEVYKPMLSNGSAIFSHLIRGFFYTYPCILMHIVFTLFPEQKKTTASLSQLCFPVFCALTLVLLTSLARSCKNWSEVYRSQLELLLADDEVALARATAEYNYPLQCYPFPKLVKFSFTFSAVTSLSLFALLLGTGVTLTEMFLNYKLIL